jgi:hypothetical protein
MTVFPIPSLGHWLPPVGLIEDLKNSAQLNLRASLEKSTFLTAQACCAVRKGHATDGFSTS